MARGKPFDHLAKHKLSDDDFSMMLLETIDNIEQLCVIYAAGKYGMSILMAGEIHKLLVEGGQAAKFRKGRLFVSNITDEQPGNLMPYYGLCGAQIRVVGTAPDLKFTMDYIPNFLFGDNSEMPRKSLEFVQWWSREVVYRDGAGRPGEHADGSVPVHSADQVPFDKRAKLSRRELITMVRNKQAAHHDQETFQVLHDLQRGLGIIHVEYPVDGGKTLSTMDGSIKIRTPPLAAMIRQIAHEALVSYGREDVYPNGGSPLYSCDPPQANG